ncbi:MAG: isoprenylcysteine carboxyl methyltransferase family protein [Alphaproteobacteria bacterium]
MSALYAIVAYIILVRLAELILAARNTRRLKARGAVETGARHYPLFVALHAGWLVAMLLAIPPQTPAGVSLVGVFAALQVVRLWVILSLGERWTTRVVVLPGTPLVKRGPYRFLRHPNYAVVAGEIAVVPLIFGAWEIALLFSALNLVLLRHRIRVENAALGRGG